MKYWFDTEFIEDGKTIELLSLGVVAEDGRQFYCEFDVDFKKHPPNPFVAEHVLPKMTGREAQLPRREVRKQLFDFLIADGLKPQIWAYYADYDWVALCQIWGTMANLPDALPRYCRDVKQFESLVGGVPHPPNDKPHHALSDAWWDCNLWYRIYAKIMVTKKDSLFFA